MFYVWVSFLMDCSVIAVFGHYTLTVLLSVLWMSRNWIAFSLAEKNQLYISLF